MPPAAFGQSLCFMKTLLLAALILVSLVSCNRDSVETPEGASNDTVMANPASDGTMTATSTLTTPVSSTMGTDTATTATPNTNTAPPLDAAPAPTSQIAAGRDVYNAKCAGCHGADGKKLAGPVTLASAQTQSKPDADLIRTIRGTGPHAGLTADEAQAAAVVAYLKALK